jgi:hypothetical protein
LFGFAGAFFLPPAIVKAHFGGAGDWGFLRLPAAIERVVGRSMLAEARDGLREVLARRWMVAGLGCDLVTNFALAILFVLPPAMVKAHVGGARDWGSLLTVGAVGVLLGSPPRSPTSPLVRFLSLPDHA